MKRRERLVLFLLALTAVVLVCSDRLKCSANSQIVYDSLVDPPSTGGYGFLSSTDIGEEVTLAGAARAITSFDVGLGSSVNQQFQLRFLNLDGVGGTPGSLIWESPVQTFPYTQIYFNRKILTISVPQITAPDHFAWTISTTPTGFFQVLSADSSPTVGTSTTGWQRTSEGTWKPLYSWAFNARITAVPEASTLCLAVCGGTVVAVALLARKRRTVGTSLS
jgi:hypothetical protein